ncbi:MAG: hypothetical protein KDD50_15710 [Bdellovibrionales bacterium]|nr:hypothetical protein [Bdellovibrionales bacterium]
MTNEEKIAKLRALVEDLSGALGFECGNRCAPQNPCNAKEALERKDAVMSEIDHDPT